MTNFARWTRASICIIALAAPRIATAQRYEPSDRTTALTSAALAAASVSLFPLDERIAAWSQRASLHRSTLVDRSFTTVEFIAGPGSYAVVGATYAIARLADERRTSDVALHTGVAMLTAGGITQILKRTLGRARPYVVHDTNSSDWQLFRGLRDFRGSDYLSFPSGHATSAFALASALSSELGYESIGHVNIIRPALYITASAVAAGRVYHDKHWASDVLMGAAVGYATGRLVTRWEHRNDIRDGTRNATSGASPVRQHANGATIANVSAIVAPTGTLFSVTVPFPRKGHIY